MQKFDPSSSKNIYNLFAKLMNKTRLSNMNNQKMLKNSLMIVYIIKILTENKRIKIVYTEINVI